MHAIVALMKLPLFKILSKYFVHFCPNFHIFCPFLPFFWKIALMPFFSKIGPVDTESYWKLLLINWSWIIISWHHSYALYWFTYLKLLISSAFKSQLRMNTKIKWILWWLFIWASCPFTYPKVCTLVTHF